MYFEPIGDIPLNIVYDSNCNNDYSTGYGVREESGYSIKREHDELFYGADSKRPKLFYDINNA
jgi:hypothetical protein